MINNKELGSWAQHFFPESMQPVKALGLGRMVLGVAGKNLT
jgi:hypothetical protein